MYGEYLVENYNPENIDVKKVHPSFANVISERETVKRKFQGVKHKIGVYSAKGGVGKTTVAVNLAYALSLMGKKVGLIDADIDCPNITEFLGIKEKQNGAYPLKPIEKSGVKVISTDMFVADKREPIIWRGPLIAKMIKDFLMNTDWGDLDYLIIDLPPGTSDAPLSIMQLLNLDGFILVTTPQHISALNTIRSGKMIAKMGVAVLGVVENMSEDDSSGQKGAREVASELGCDILGSIKFDKRLSEYSDSGKIPVLESEQFKGIFTKIAEKLE